MFTSDPKPIKYTHSHVTHMHTNHYCQCARLQDKVQCSSAS